MFGRSVCERGREGKVEERYQRFGESAQYYNRKNVPCRDWRSVPISSEKYLHPKV